MTDQLTLEQGLQEIFPTLPAPIQRFIKEGKPGETAQTIMDRYILHVDQGAIIEHQILLALFGVIGPEEFADTLSDQLIISNQTIGEILEDVNKEVFLPLRDEMRHPVEPVAAPVAPPKQQPVQPLNTIIIPANPRIPPRAPQTLTPTSTYVPKLPPPRSINLIAGNGERSALRDALNAVTTGQIPAALKAAQPDRMLEDHEEPHIEFHQAPPVPRPAPPNPFGVFSVNKPRPPANLPGAMPPSSLNVPPRGTSGEHSAEQNVLATPPSPPMQPYSTDPYREPIEP